MDESLDKHVLERYNIIEKIGSGRHLFSFKAYGIVWKVYDKITKEILALKKIVKAFVNKIDALRTVREVIILEALVKAKHIVTIKNVICSSNNLDFYLVFEYIEYDLTKIIQSKALSLTNCRKIFYQLLLGLEEIHKRNLVHRDLKPANILIDKNYTAVIADFGLVRPIINKVMNSFNIAMTNYVATRWYRAPELLLGCSTYGKEVDIWSLGCIFAEILFAKPLFPGSCTLDQLTKIIEFTNIPSYHELLALGNIKYTKMIYYAKPKVYINHEVKFREIPVDIQDLMVRMLKFLPNERINVYSALSHPCFTEFRQGSKINSQNININLPPEIFQSLQPNEYKNCLYKNYSLTASRPIFTFAANNQFYTEKNSDNWQRLASLKPKKPEISANMTKLTFQKDELRLNQNDFSQKKLLNIGIYKQYKENFENATNFTSYNDSLRQNILNHNTLNSDKSNSIRQSSMEKQWKALYKHYGANLGISNVIKDSIKKAYYKDIKTLSNPSKLLTYSQKNNYYHIPDKAESKTISKYKLKSIFNNHTQYKYSSLLADNSNKMSTIFGVKKQSVIDNNSIFIKASASKPFSQSIYGYTHNIKNQSSNLDSYDFNHSLGKVTAEENSYFSGTISPVLMNNNTSHTSKFNNQQYRMKNRNTSISPSTFNPTNENEYSKTYVGNFQNYSKKNSFLTKLYNRQSSNTSNLLHLKEKNRYTVDQVLNNKLASLSIVKKNTFVNNFKNAQTSSTMKYNFAIDSFMHSAQISKLQTNLNKLKSTLNNIREGM